jgi:hypothetical protein
MKLTVDVLRYLSKDDFRVLTAVEMGMRNVCFSLSLSLLIILCFVLAFLTSFNWIQIVL